MIATYAIPTVAPLHGQIGAAMMLGSVGWAALASLAVGVVALVVLMAHDRLRRPEVPIADAVEHEPRLAA